MLAAAGFYGLGPGILAAIGSALAFNFYFTHPYHTFRITSPQDVATVALLFLVALVTSQLAAGMRAQARAAKASAARNATIAGLARRLLSCSTDEQIAEIACRELGRLFDCNAVLMAGRPEPHVVAARPSHATLNPDRHGRRGLDDPVGRAGRARSGGGQCHGVDLLSHPVRRGRPWRHRPRPRRRPAPGAGRSGSDLLDNLVDQVALALERSRLEAEARGLSELRERNRIRSALLSTIGQDIEPRLSAITGGVDELRRSGSSDKSLVSAIGSEAQKLRQYLASLLEFGPETDQKPLEAGDVTIDLFHRVGDAGTAKRFT